jgi:hypothetical protein
MRDAIRSLRVVDQTCQIPAPVPSVRPDTDIIRAAVWSMPPGGTGAPPAKGQGPPKPMDQRAWHI